MTNAVHPGGLNATQSLNFFHANGIKGLVIPSRNKRTVLVEYTCKSQCLNGSIENATHRILAPAQRQNIGAMLSHLERMRPVDSRELGRVVGDGPNDIPF